MAKEKKAAEAAPAPSKSSNENNAKNEALKKAAAGTKRGTALKWVAGVSNVAFNQQPYDLVDSKKTNKQGNPIQVKHITGTAPGLDSKILAGTKNDWALRIVGGWKNFKNKSGQVISKQLTPATDEQINAIIASAKSAGGKVNASNYASLVKVIQENLKGTGGGGGRSRGGTTEFTMDFED